MFTSEATCMAVKFAGKASKHFSSILVLLTVQTTRVHPQCMSSNTEFTWKQHGWVPLLEDTLCTAYILRKPRSWLLGQHSTQRNQHQMDLLFPHVLPTLAPDQSGKLQASACVHQLGHRGSWSPVTNTEMVSAGWALGELKAEEQDASRNPSHSRSSSCE